MFAILIVDQPSSVSLRFAAVLEMKMTSRIEIGRKQFLAIVVNSIGVLSYDNEKSLGKEL